MENKTAHLRYAGELDPGFTQDSGIPGWVDILRALDWPPVRDLFFSSIAPTPSACLYVGGYFAETAGSPVEYFIARLLDDGQRDTAFGTDGLIRGTFPVNFKMIAPTRVVVQSDGKILMQASGYAGSEEMPDPVLFVARFLDTGDADPEFGEQGLMRHDLPAGEYNFLVPFVGDLQQLPDGRILASSTGVSFLAQGPRERAVLYRLTGRGELDVSFNGSGWLDFGVPGASLRVNEFVTRPDGSIVVAGQITAPQDGYTKGMLARLDNQGNLDKTFGPLGTGFFEFALDSYNVEVNSVAIRPNGALVCVGAAYAMYPDRGLRDQGFIMDMTADGLPGNLLITPINEVYSVQWVSVHVQRDGKLLVAGRSRSEVTPDAYMYVARYNLDGTPDITFGNQGSGRVETFVGGFNDVPIEMREQADGKIVVGVNATSFRKGILLRYLND